MRPPRSELPLVHAPKSAVSHSALRAPTVVAAQSDVVFERGTERGFLFVRRILARRTRLEDLYSFWVNSTDSLRERWPDEVWSIRYSRLVVGATVIVGTSDRTAR